MSGFARRDVEILVHVGAPSRGADDTRYRMLAEAYMNFEPTRRKKLELRNMADGIGEKIQYHSNKQSQNDPISHPLAERESAASYRPEEETRGISSTPSKISPQNFHRRSSRWQSIESPQLSFSSAFDNADSPMARWQPRANANITPKPPPHTQSSAMELWQAPSSVVADSQAVNDTSLVAFSSPTRILELFLQSQKSERSEGLSPTSNTENQTADMLVDEISSLLHTSSQMDKSDSSPLAKRRKIDTPKSSKEAVLQSSDVLGEVERIRGNAAHSLPSSNFTCIGPPAPMPERVVPQSNPQETARGFAMPAVSLPIGKGSEQIPSSAATVPASSNLNLTNWSDKLEISSNPPPTSTARITPEMLVTPALQKIVKRVPSKFHCQSAEPRRDLRPLERGYWLVDCRTWENSLRDRAWNYLGNFVGNDLAGWGVRCSRTSNHGSLRVYCWGIIVPHIYLILFIASERKIIGTSPSWIGGDGSALIEMPP